jgi:hypothetical protein
VVFIPNQAAWTKKDGRFHSGRWGFETRIAPDRNGLYSIPPRVAKVLS